VTKGETSRPTKNMVVWIDLFELINWHIGKCETV